MEADSADTQTVKSRWGGAWMDGSLQPLSTGLGLARPAPPSFSSAHHIDHIFVFSFSIFISPRVLRKAGLLAEPGHLVAEEASPEQWWRVWGAWAQEDRGSQCGDTGG